MVASGAGTRPVYDTESVEVELEEAEVEDLKRLVCPAEEEEEEEDGDSEEDART